MKTPSYLLIAFIFIALTALPVFSVGQAALPTLLLEIGSKNTALGGAGVALSDDIYSVFYNPAAIAALYKRNHIHLEYGSFRQDLLPEFQIKDLYHQAKFFGIYWPKSYYGFNFAFSYYWDYISFGENEWTDEWGNSLGTFKSWDEFNIYTLAVGYKDICRLGLTYKNIYSNLADVPVGPNGEKGILEDAWAFDLGLQASYKFSYKFIPIIAEPSAGITWLNMGPDIYYINPDRKDPLPYAISGGAALRLDLLEFAGITYTYQLLQERPIRPEVDPDTVTFDEPYESQGYEIRISPFYAVQKGWMFDKAGWRNERIEGYSIIIDIKKFLVILHRLGNRDFHPKSEKVRKINEAKIKIGNFHFTPNIRFTSNRNTIYGNGNMDSARNGQKRFDITLGF